MTGSPAHEHGSDGLTCSHPEVHSQTLWKENERLRQQNAALRDALHRDKTRLAKALEQVTRLCKGYDWATTGRGPYEWDDDQYRAEFGGALGAIHTVAYKALVDSGSLANAALTQAEKP